MIRTDPYTVVAIPTLGESGMLTPLLDALWRQGGYDELIVMDNTPEGRVQASLRCNWFEKLEMKDCADWPFHKMWNWAWAHAKVSGTARRGVPSNLVLLNDDIRIPNDFVIRLTATMRSDDDCWCAYPDWRLPLDRDEWGAMHRLTQTYGTYKDGGLWGCAFAVRGEILNDPLPSIDEQFVIWCGDDDLVKQIDLAGKKTCRVEGLALEHEASTTFQKYPELHEIGWQDMERFRAKYSS